MGTRKNKKNRNRKTKRKLIKGDPVTFLKSLKTPEQIRKHSLFKKRTVKRNMRGGGQPDKPTRKKNIKDLINKINNQYKNTKWTLEILKKNIKSEY